jgi:hypothetical protein
VLYHFVARMRSDNIYETSVLCRPGQHTMVRNWDAAQQVGWYLLHTIDHRHRLQSSGEVILALHADSDFAISPEHQSVVHSTKGW